MEQDKGASANADRAASLTASAVPASQSGIPSAHTPGPWFVGDEDEDMGGWEYTDVHAGEDSSQSYISIAHVQGCWDGDQEMRLDATTRANARLIAAAPELLEALQYARTIIGYDEIIDSALAKATGGAA